MKQIEYELPVFTDSDKADLNLYSSKMAEALKTQTDKIEKNADGIATINGKIGDIDTVLDFINGEVI